MKKKILKVSIISLLMTSIFVISVAAATGNLNIFVSEDGIAEREDLDKVSAVQFFSDEKIQLNYDVSRSVKDGFADIYKDEKGNDYIYKNGKLTGFYSNEIKMPTPDATPIGKENSIKIAKEWLAQFSDHIEDYEMQSFDEKENYGQYYITFARKLGEIFTDEQAIISVMYNGEVKSVAVYNDGKYNNVSESIVEGITEDVLRSHALSEMEIIYPDSGTEFELKDYCLEGNAGGYYISIYGNIDNMLESVRYELED